MLRDEEQFKTILRFELNKQYEFRNNIFLFLLGALINVFFFDKDGNKYSLGLCHTDQTWETAVEYVRPLGRNYGCLFSNK